MMESPRSNNELDVNLHALLDAIPGQVALIAKDGQILEVNARWTQFARENSGHDFNFLEANYLEVCDTASGEDTEDAAIVAKAIRDVASGKRADASLVYPCHSPSEKRWFRVCLSSIDSDHLLIIHSNVTSEHLTRELLDEHEFKLHTIIGSQSECIKTLARDGTILEMNQGGMALLGTRNSRDVLGQNVLEFIDLEDHPEFRSFFKKVLEGTSGTIEFRVIGVDGRMAWVRSICSPMRGRSGENVVETVLCISHDISLERESIEQARAMRERETLLASARQLAHMGTWVHDLPTKRLIWSLETCEIFGVTEAEFDGRFETFHNMILPEDKPDFDQSIKRSESSKDGVFQTHYRIRRPDGEIRSIYERGQSVLGIDRQVVRRLGVVIDNTEQRHVKDLLERNKQLLQIACEAGRLGGWYLSLSDSQLTWTPETFEIHEVEPSMGPPSLEEAIHFYALESRDKVQHLVEQCCLKGIRFDDEFEIITAKGNRLWVRSIGEPVFNEEETIVAVQGAFQDVSQQKEAEETAGKLALELVETLESISDAFFTVDETCQVLFANAHAAQLMEVELKGAERQRQSISFFLPEWIKPAICRAAEQARRTGLPAQIEVHDPEHDRWYGGRAYDSLESTSIYLHDETSVMAAKRDLEISEERFRLYAAASNDAIWDWDISTDELWWSKGFQTLFGKDHEFENPTTRSWKERVHPEDLERITHETQAVVNSLETRWRGEYRFKKADGTYAEVSDYGSVIRNEEGEAIRMVGGMSDLTEQKRLEEQVLRAQRLDSLGTLAGGVAHDLNNVLTPILFSLELMRDEPDPEERLQNIDIIESCARRGSQMVSQLLSFARGSHDERTTLDVSEIINDVDQMARETFPRGIAIRTEISEDLWPALGNASQIHQVLMNLAVNARDAMPSGGVLSIRASNELIDDVYAGMNLSARAGAYVKVEVEDTGTGIPPDVLKRIFEPFFTTKEVGNGTGLGLSTTHSIVKSHDGFINVYTEVDQGTRFHIYLPVSGVVDEPIAGPGVSKSKLPRGKGECILVVDDEPEIRTMVKRTLERFGYAVLLAEHGAEAVSLYASNMDQIAAVLTDMAMPIMDGASTVVALRSINPDVRIIGSSGFKDRSSHDIAVDLKYFVEKPYTAETMLRTLRDALED